MKNKEHINKQIADSFKVLDEIDRVEVNHFFKHKVLQKIKAEKTINKPVFSWFTPQIQLATLGLILLLNVSAIFYAYSSTEVSVGSDINTFAEEYSLKTNSNSILN
jgi:hypothetical protein